MTDQWKIYKSKMSVIKFYAHIGIGFMLVRKYTYFPYKNIDFSYSGYNCK